MITTKESCANCKYFCQDGDPEDMLYFDSKTGECRRSPPHGHFLWYKTRPHQWCGQWAAKSEKLEIDWKRVSDHPKTADPVILYQSGMFCSEAGMVVGYWNGGFEKWHDGGDRLLDRDDVTDWMPLPRPPKR